MSLPSAAAAFRMMCCPTGNPSAWRGCGNANLLARGNVSAGTQNAASKHEPIAGYTSKWCADNRTAGAVVLLGHRQRPRSAGRAPAKSVQAVLATNHWHKAAAVINASKRLERSCTHSQTPNPHSRSSHTEHSPEAPRVVRELLLVHQWQLLPHVRLKEGGRLARAQRESCHYQHKDHGRSNQGQPALHRSRRQANTNLLPVPGSVSAPTY